MNLAKIKELRKNIDILEDSREIIIDIWIKDYDVDLILKKYNIDKKLFAQNYANHVLTYFIEVVSGTEEIGNCPIIKKLLEYFKEKNITSSELFIICINFRKAIIKKFIKNQKMTEEMYENVSYVFDANFRGVLEQFENTISKAQAETKRIYEISIRDHLTKLFNRKMFDEILLKEIQNSHRKNTPLSIILLDIDNFKNINDIYGHDTGDEVLVAFSSILAQSIRASDTVARWGGEEFIVLMPESTKENAFNKAEKIRKKIEKNNFKTVDKVTCSFGISQIKKEDDSSSIFNRADKGLYHSKQHGKNMVTFL